MPLAEYVIVYFQVFRLAVLHKKLTTSQRFIGNVKNICILKNQWTKLEADEEGSLLIKLFGGYRGVSSIRCMAS